MKITTFETAKVGDRVWSIKEGWGKISRIDYGSDYPLSVKYDISGNDTFTFGGYEFRSDPMRTLFWDEIVIKAPVKPMPVLQVDAKVLVWEGSSRNKFYRHFSHFENNKIHAFDGGLSSWTGSSASAWDNWELAE